MSVRLRASRLPAQQTDFSPPPQKDEHPHLLQKDCRSFEIVASSSCSYCASVAVNAIYHRYQIDVRILFPTLNISVKTNHLVEVFVVVYGN